MYTQFSSIFSMGRKQKCGTNDSPESSSLPVMFYGLQPYMTLHTFSARLDFSFLLRMVSID